MASPTVDAEEGEDVLRDPALGEGHVEHVVAVGFHCESNRNLFLAKTRRRSRSRSGRQLTVGVGQVHVRDVLDPHQVDPVRTKANHSTASPDPQRLRAKG